MIERSTDIKAALRSRQRGFLLNPFRFGSTPPSDPDPHWDKVVLLLKMDGAVDSTTFVDSGPLGLTVGASFLVRQSETWSVAGRSAEFYSGGGFLAPTSTALAFGTEDFCIETTIRIPSGFTAGGLFDARPTYANGAYVTFVVGSTTILLYVDGSTRIEGTHGIAANTPTHVALSRVAGVSRIFVAGTQCGSSWTDSTNYGRGTDRPLIGALGYDSGLERFIGFMDEYRVTKGEGRYSANFTPPTGPFPTHGP